MITGYDLINEYYESEKLYSTGDSELDDLLERAFCEGYEYAQREFGNKENKAAKRKYEIELGKSLHIGTNDTEEYLLQQSRKHQKLNPYDTADSGNRSLDAYINQKNEFRNRGQNIPGSKETNDRFTDTIMAQHIAKHQQHKKDASPDLIKKTKRVFDRSFERGKKLNKRGIREENINDIKNLIKDHKGAVIGGTLGTAALVGGGIVIHRHNKKKKSKEDKKNRE